MRDLKNIQSPPPPMSRQELFAAGIAIGFVGAIFLSVAMHEVIRQVPQ